MVCKIMFNVIDARGAIKKYKSYLNLHSMQNVKKNEIPEHMVL